MRYFYTEYFKATHISCDMPLINPDAMMVVDMTQSEIDVYEQWRSE